MNRSEVQELVEENEVVAIKADKTQENPAIDQLLTELGNPGAGIPFLAVFPADGEDPITHDGPITKEEVLEALRKAGPSKSEEDKRVARRSDQDAVVN